MRSTTRTIATLALGAFLVTACSGAAATPTAAPEIPPPASPTPAVGAPTIAPIPAPTMTTGKGPQHFSYLTGSGPYLEVQYTEKQVGDVLQYRGGVSAWDFKTTDPRMQGHASFAFSIDAYGSLGFEWGTMTITNTDGAWAGTWTGKCSGATWATGDRTVMSCWLAGNGAHKGFSAYYSLADLGTGNATMEGVIFPGAVPKF